MRTPLTLLAPFSIKNNRWPVLSCFRSLAGVTGDMKTPEFHKALKDILRDNRSGSTYLSEKIERVFPFIPEHDFQKTISEILTSHSSMASVINRVNRLCLQREGKRIENNRDVSRSTYRTFWRENRAKKTWITLSMSHWVIECLKACPDKCRIKIGISYPDREGLWTAEKLNGFHRVEIHEDGFLCSEVEKSDGVLLGADLITQGEIVNKTGSLCLALAAKYYRKPLYIISSGDKFLTRELTPFYKIKKVERGNRTVHYFESLPREMVSKLYLTTAARDLSLSETLKELTDQSRG